jgi:anaerobic selenocysteine-containing dehydrogenase
MNDAEDGPTSEGEVRMSDEKLSKVSRRSFMKRSAVAGAGAAAIAGLGGTAGAAKALAAPSAESRTPAEPSEEPVVAYVRAGSSGEVTVMVGEREVVRRDRELARRILRAAR